MHNSLRYTPAVLVLALGVPMLAGAATPAQHHHSDAGHVSALKKAVVKHVTLRASYHGTIALLWSANSVSAVLSSGTGTATYMGASRLSGLGTSPSSSTCDTLTGSGVLSGLGSTLHVRVVASSRSQACAAGDTAPTSVTLHGTAVVVSGTGTWKGASGTLHFTGSFSIQSNTAGSKEADTYSATLSGVLLVK
jgi:hypothetical protein